VQGKLAASKRCDVLHAQVGNIRPRKLMFFKHVPFCCYWCWRPSGSVSYQALLIWYQNSGIQTISGDWPRGSSAAVFIVGSRLVATPVKSRGCAQGAKVSASFMVQIFPSALYSPRASTFCRQAAIKARCEFIQVIVVNNGSNEEHWRLCFDSHSSAVL